MHADPRGDNRRKADQTQQGERNRSSSPATLTQDHICQSSDATALFLGW
jgi:hypothetical protein